MSELFQFRQAAIGAPTAKWRARSGGGVDWDEQGRVAGLAGPELWSRQAWSRRLLGARQAPGANLRPVRAWRHAQPRRTRGPGHVRHDRTHAPQGGPRAAGAGLDGTVES